MRECIFACASGSGPSAVAVIRLSGPDTLSVLNALDVAPPPWRKAALRMLKAPNTRETLDKAIVITFAEGASYTGEISAELQIHGGIAVVEAVSAALEAAGARLARPGEFTRRALAHGNLDLSQAEAVGALINSETEYQRRQALRVLQGEVSDLAERWRAELISIMALLETGIDFVDEDLGADLIQKALTDIQSMEASLQTHVTTTSQAAVLVERPLVLLLGPPNAGKSMLLNALAGQDRVIVSEVPGTTRDRVEVDMSIGGFAVRVSDSAGVRLTSDTLEAEGVQLTLQSLPLASVRFFVVSADTLDAFEPLKSYVQPSDVILWNKSDVRSPTPTDWARLPPAHYRVVSALSPVDVRAVVADAVASELATVTGFLSPIAGSERRQALLKVAVTTLADASRRIDEGRIELSIEELRRCVSTLSALTGDIGHEDVLDQVFSSFCIGK